MGDAESAFEGGLTGAGIGTAISPGAGTAIGGLVGLAAGGLTDMFGGDDSAMKRLMARQKELAAEMERQRQDIYEGRVQALNQGVQALAPYNRMVGQMVGPEAAFSGEQVAAMTGDPKGGPQAQYPWIEDAYERGVADKPLIEFAQYMGQTGLVNGRTEIPKDRRAKVQHDYDTLQDYARKRREYEATTQSQRQALDTAFGTPPPRQPPPQQQAAPQQPGRP